MSSEDEANGGKIPDDEMEGLRGADGQSGRETRTRAAKNHTV